MRGYKMERIVERMNYNLSKPKTEKSDLGDIYVRLIQQSIKNGSFQYLAEIFEREFPSPRCFAGERYSDLVYAEKYANYIFEQYRNEIKKENSYSNSSIEQGSIGRKIA